MHLFRGRSLTTVFTLSILVSGSLSAFTSSAGSATADSHPAVHRDAVAAAGPYNSLLNTLPIDNSSPQSETSVAVCDDLTANDCPTPIVMVGYNDLIPSGSSLPSAEGVGYSVAFDGGTRWTDEGTLPYYKDSSGFGYHLGDPALTVDKNGVFYFADLEETHNNPRNEFVGMSTCKYSSTVGIACSRPVAVTRPALGCGWFGLNVAGPVYDKPAITYDPVHNRVYVSWTYVTYSNPVMNCNETSEVPQFRYYTIGTRTWSQTYTVPTSSGGFASGTAPIASGGRLFLFFENFTPTNSIQYVTFVNGSLSSVKTLHTVVPIGYANDSACGTDPNTGLPIPALDTQAWDQNHPARTNEFPSAAVDSQGNMDVVWNGAPTPSEGSGQSVIWVATLLSGGGAPHIQELPDLTDTTGHLLIQWQPSVAYAGGSNGLAVGYFQVIQLSGGSYQIQRNQVTATASATPSFGAAQMISTVSWKPPPASTVGCYEGDYSGAASNANANVVWSYWGDSRNKDPNGQPEQDVYGLYTSVP